MANAHLSCILSSSNNNNNNNSSQGANKASAGLKPTRGREDERSNSSSSSSSGSRSNSKANSNTSRLELELGEQDMISCPQETLDGDAGSSAARRKREQAYSRQQMIRLLRQEVRPQQQAQDLQRKIDRQSDEMRGFESDSQEQAANGQQEEVGADETDEDRLQEREEREEEEDEEDDEDDDDEEEDEEEEEEEEEEVGEEEEEEEETQSERRLRHRLGLGLLQRHRPRRHHNHRLRQSNHERRADGTADDDEEEEGGQIKMEAELLCDHSNEQTAPMLADCDLSAREKSQDNDTNDTNNNGRQADSLQAGGQTNELIVKQLARVEHRLATLENKFRAQDHRLKTIEGANREILLKLGHLTLALESLASPSAVAAAVAAASAATTSDPNNNNNTNQNNPNSLGNASQLNHAATRPMAQQLLDQLHNKSTHHSLFHSLQQQQQRQQHHHLQQHDQNNNNCATGQISASSSVSSSPSISPTEPQNNQAHSLLHLATTNTSSQLNQDSAANANGLSLSRRSHQQQAQHHQQQQHHQHHHHLTNHHRPLSLAGSIQNSGTANNTTASSRHSSASVSPSLGGQHSAAVSPLGAQLSGNSAAQNGLAVSSAAAQLAAVAAAAASQQQQDPQSSAAVAAMGPAFQFLCSALARSQVGNQLGELDHHLLASTLGVAAAANASAATPEVATNLTNHLAKPGATNSAPNHHQAGNNGQTVTPQSVAQQLASSSAMAAQIAAAAAAAANNNRSAGQPGAATGTGAGSGANLPVVHSIPHPHSHHALSHPAASLLMNNPHYQTVRTKYSTRRYSRRRVGPDEAMADPAIRATVQLRMAVVPKTILIVLKHRLTVQTAITLACAQTGERLRKGAIQKKLEAMFREPGAVDNFLAEYDHPR